MKPIPRVMRLTAAVLTGMAACLCVAADSPLDSFKKLRADWKSAVMDKTRPLRESYARRLRELETHFSASGDYESAAQARKERLRISGEGRAPEFSHGSLPGPVEKGQPVSLEMGSARLTGGVKLQTESGTLTGWTAQEAAARWPLPAGLEAGGYSVEITYASAPGAGGVLRLNGDVHSLRRELSATGGEADFQQKIIGTLRLTTGCRWLNLTAESVKGSGLMQLKAIRLLPPAETK